MCAACFKFVFLKFTRILLLIDDRSRSNKVEVKNGFSVTVSMALTSSTLFAGLPFQFRSMGRVGGAAPPPIILATLFTLLLGTMCSFLFDRTSKLYGFNKEKLLEHAISETL